MDSAKLTEENSVAKSNVNTNQQKKDDSESATLNEKTANTEEIKPKKSKSMAKKTGRNSDTAEMVLEALKSLKMRKGAPVEAICQQIEDKHSIDMKKLKIRVQRYLKNGLEKGDLEESTKGKFKIKRKDVSKKETQIERRMTRSQLAEQKKTVKRKSVSKKETQNERRMTRSQLSEQKKTTKRKDVSRKET